MQLADVPPLEKVVEVVDAVDPEIKVSVVDGNYLREIEGSWYGFITRPRQHITYDPAVGPQLPEATIRLDPSFAGLDEGAILGEFARAAADLSRDTLERAAIADAQIEP